MSDSNLTIDIGRVKQILKEEGMSDWKVFDFSRLDPACNRGYCNPETKEIIFFREADIFTIFDEISHSKEPGHTRDNWGLEFKRLLRKHCNIKLKDDSSPP